MTDTPAKVLAARALIEAYDALNSDEHRADVDKRRELDLQRAEISERIAAREDAYEAAMNDKHAADEAACATGEAEPAENQQARSAFSRYFNGNHPTLSQDTDEGLSLDDLAQSYPPDDEPKQRWDEAASAKCNGGLSESYPNGYDEGA